MNYEFDHLHLVSKDPLKTSEFYEKRFDAKKDMVGKLPDGRTVVCLSMKEVSIVITNPREKPLIPNTLPDGCGIEHFGFRTGNIEKAVFDLKKNGIKFVQDITRIDPNTRIAFLVSPENILIELVEVNS